MAKVKAIVFDSNETLLDTSALDPHFARAFGSGPAARERWFRQLLELAFVANITGRYQNFEWLGDAALTMVAAQLGVELAAEARAAILGAIPTLPPHPDVRAALERLAAAKLRLAVLTNSTKSTARAQLGHAGLAAHFDEIVSVDAVECYKPAPAAYAYAAKKLRVKVKEIRLVAAHGWDVAGALAAGARAAFVARPGKALDPLAPRPDVAGADLGAVAAALVERGG